MKTVKENRNESATTKSIALTEKENKVLGYIVATKGGIQEIAAGDEESDEFCLDEVYPMASKDGITKCSVKAIVGSLTKKGLLSMYGSESYYDGKLSGDWMSVVLNVEDNNVSEENQTKETNESNMDNPMVDERIVRLNEIKATKLASVSKTKRITLKAAKPAAQYLTENWDSEDNLRHFTEDEENKTLINEVWCIAKSRLDQLVAKREKEEQAKAEKAAAKPKKSKESTVEAEPKKEGKKKAGSKHKIGDHNPVYPNLLWTEIAPGKFSWRKPGWVPGKKRNHAPKDTQSVAKPEPKKKVAKEKPAEAPKQEPERIGIQEWLQSERVSRKPLTKEQKKSLKAIKKGATISKDKKFFIYPDMTLAACNYDSVKALFANYQLDYLPVGLERDK